MGLQAAIREVVDFAINAIERDDAGDEPPPIAALAQARRAARAGVGLETVLRRYAAGDRVLNGVLANEAGLTSFNALRDIQRTLGATVDRLMAAVAEEYELEAARLGRKPNDHLFDRIRRLLAGELALDSVVDYSLNAWHIAMIAEAQLDEKALREMSHEADRQCLVVPAERGQTWVWIGGRTRLAVEDVEAQIHRLATPYGTPLGVGEARFGATGWRLSHGEAKIALELPSRPQRLVVRSLDALLIVAVLRDPVFAESLSSSFLQPLDNAGKRPGIELRRTLRAYLAAGQNATTAAAILQIDRHTVRGRLKTSEEAIGRTIEECHAELQVALRVEKILIGEEEAPPPSDFVHRADQSGRDG